MSWEERKAEAPEAGGGPRAWNVFVSVSVRPRKEERVSKIGTVSVSNQEPAVSTGNDWLASSAPGHGAPCPGLAAQAEGSPDLQRRCRASGQLRGRTRQRSRSPGTGVTKPPPQAAV